MEDRDIQSAFDKGRAAALKGESIRSNPYRPLSDEELYLAWDIAFEEFAPIRVRAAPNRIGEK